MKSVGFSAWTFAMALSVSVLPGICWAGTPCLYGVDTICGPDRMRYGFYEPKWRRWPAELVAEDKRQQDITDRLRELPAGDVPDQTEEGELDPDVPKGPGGTSSGRESRAGDPTDQFFRDLREDPFRDDDPLTPDADGAALQPPNSIEKAFFVSQRTGSVTPRERVVTFGELPEAKVSPQSLELVSTATFEIPVSSVSQPVPAAAHAQGWSDDNPLRSTVIRRARAESTTLGTSFGSSPESATDESDAEPLRPVTAARPNPLRR